MKALNLKPLAFEILYLTFVLGTVTTDNPVIIPVFGDAPLRAQGPLDITRQHTYIYTSFSGPVGFIFTLYPLDVSNSNILFGACSL